MFVFDAKTFSSDEEKYYQLHEWGSYYQELFGTKEGFFPSCAKIYIDINSITSDINNLNIKTVKVKESYGNECEFKDTFFEKFIDYILYDLSIVCDEHKYIFVKSTQHYFTDGSSQSLDRLEIRDDEIRDDATHHIGDDGIYDAIYKIICN